MPINKAFFTILPPSIFTNLELSERSIEIPQEFKNLANFCLLDLVL